MQIIATDPPIDGQNLGALHARFWQLLAANADWENLVLISREKQLVNAIVPYGTPLPDRQPVNYQAQAFATMQPAVSDLFMSRVRGAEIVSVAVPVIRNGSADYLLLVGLRRAALSEGLRKMVPRDGVASIYDRSFRILARTRDRESNLGTLPRKPLLDAMRAAREGLAVLTTWTALDNGWWIATGTPTAAPDRALARYAALLGLAWLACCWPDS